VQLTLTPFLVLEIVLVLAVIAMIVWRKMISRNEDDTLHVMHGAGPSVQSELAQKLDVIDKWGNILTVITVVFGLLVGAAYVYQTWVTSSKILE
jgi:hypothetical protein